MYGSTFEKHPPVCSQSVRFILWSGWVLSGGCGRSSVVVVVRGGGDVFSLDYPQEIRFSVTAQAVVTSASMRDMQVME